MPTHRWGRAHTRPGVLSCLIALLLIVPGPMLAASPSIVIGEVNWAGSSRSPADEWVELWNIGMQDRSLSGWRLEGASTTPIAFDKTQIIPAQQAFLVSNYDEMNSKSVLNIHPAVVTTDISLSNDALDLRLVDDKGSLIDQVGDGKKPFAGDTKPPTSMIRTDIGVSIPPSALWKSVDYAQNLDAGVGDLGTPGFCDGCHTATTSTPPETPSSIPVATSTDPMLEVSTSTPPKLDTATSTVDSVATSTTSVTPLLEATSTSAFATTTVAIPPSSLSTTSTKLDSGFSYSTSTDTLTSATTTALLGSSSTSSLISTKTMSAAVSASSSTQTAPPSSNTVTAATIQNPIPIITCRARLETIFPAPSSGPEWIEVSGCDTPQELVGWSVHDSQSLILTVTSLTAVESLSEGAFRIPLPGQHLNNGGDTVMLRGPDDGLYDIIAYPSVRHDEHYARQGDNTWWIPERVPNTTASNAIAPTLIAPTAVAKNESTQNVPLNVAPTPPATITTPPPIIARAASVMSFSLADYSSTHVTNKPSSKPKSINKKVSKPKRLSSPSMSLSLQAPRVTLYGIVGTPPNLIAKRRFVLLNADGKGVLVRANNLQPSPALGTRIRVTGSLITNDDGTYLDMRTRDRWQASQMTINDPTPTPFTASVDDAEPSWRLAEVSGVVASRSGNSIHLTVGDDEVVATISSSLAYRPARLAVGDEIRLSGLLSTEHHPARIYPRTTDDIVIVKPAHAPTFNTSSNTHDSLPPWIPVSAAGTTMAAGYGLRRLRQWYEERRLAQQLSSALEQLSSTS